jgi:hypothetical protein
MNVSGYSVNWIRTYRQTAPAREFDELAAFSESVVFGHKGKKTSPKFN